MTPIDKNTSVMITGATGYMAGWVVKKLAVSKRTLQRNLNGKNTSFQQELNKTREKPARHYLVNSSY